MMSILDSGLYERALAFSRNEPNKIGDAHELLSCAAKEGDERAMYALATWHLFGNEVVEKDEARAFKELKNLKNSNIAEALFDLAVCYDYGRGTRKSSKLAFLYYMKAALLGDSESCSQVAQFYREGKTVLFEPDLYDAWELRSSQDEKDISPAYRVWLTNKSNS